LPNYENYTRTYKFCALGDSMEIGMLPLILLDLF
jgi:hypothetical protein